LPFLISPDIAEDAGDPDSGWLRLPIIIVIVSWQQQPANQPQ